MAEALVNDESKTIRILLVGQTGHGKSSTGNSLLGYQKDDKRAFVSKKSFKSVTKSSEPRVETRFGHRLEVVDTPGFADTSGSDDIIRRQIGRALYYTRPGFHCVAFVLMSARLTDTITKTIESFFDHFGKDVGAYACLILTHIATEEDKTDYLDSLESVDSDDTNQHESKNVKKLMKLCHGKVLAIENTPENNNREHQVEAIINRIAKIKTENKQPHFTNEMFEAATEAFDEREQKKMQELQDMEREQERREKSRKDELRRVQEENERIKKESESKNERQAIEESLKLIAENNMRRMDILLQIERDREMHNFQLHKLRLEMDKDKQNRPSSGCIPS